MGTGGVEAVSPEAGTEEWGELAVETSWGTLKETTSRAWPHRRPMGRGACCPAHRTTLIIGNPR